MMSSMPPQGGGPPPRRTMLEEVEEALAQSMLVFLLADLRLLSATGRIQTKYETIAIARYVGKTLRLVFSFVLYF